MVDYAVPLLLGPGESMLSYIHRLAEANVLPVASVATDLGLVNLVGGLSGEDCQKIAHLTGEDIGDISPWQITRLPSGGFRYLDAELPIRLVEREIVRLCPSCFRAEATHRVIWDIKFICCCPIHGEKLISRCPRCGLRLLKTSNNLFVCRKRHDVRECPPMSALKARPPELWAAAHFYQKCRIPEELPRLNFPSYLEDVPLGLYLGEVVLLGRIRCRLTGRSFTQTAPAYRRLFVEGHYYFRCWPRRLLEELFSFGVVTDFPIDRRLFFWLSKVLTNSQEDGVGFEVANVIVQRLVGMGYFVLPHILRASRDGGGPSIYTLRTASRITGLRPGVCKQTARHQQWAGWKGLDYPRFFGILGSSVQEWLGVNPELSFPSDGRATKVHHR